MSKISNSLCIRCGIERIFLKSWKEKVGNSLIIYSQFVCPNPSCQEIVEKKLKKEKDHIEAIQARALERKKANIRNRKNKKKTLKC